MADNTFSTRNQPYVCWSSSPVGWAERSEAHPTKLCCKARKRLDPPREKFETAVGDDILDNGCIGIALGRTRDCLDWAATLLPGGVRSRVAGISSAQGEYLLHGGGEQSIGVLFRG